MRKLVSVLLSVFIILPIIILPYSAARADDTVSISADVYYMQSEARELLDFINPWRTSPDVWEYDRDNNRINRTTIPLTYDYKLERVAMQRAAEAALGGYSLGHTRPDNSSCFTCTYDGISSRGECLAWGYGSAEGVFEAWKEENCDYSGQGHRRIMLMGAAVGIACCRMNNGMTVWALEIGYIDPNNTPTDPVDGTIEVNFDIAQDYITANSVSVGQSCVVVTENCTASLPSIVSTFSTTFGYSATSVTDINWQSDNNSVATVQNNRLLGVMAGSCNLVGSFGGRQISIPVQVYNASASYGSNISEQRYNNILTFVNRLYSIALNRVPDSAGLKGWTNQILNGNNTGADAARGVLLSTEYIRRNVSDSEYINTLYRIFFDREPDEGGRINWMNALATESREQVLYGFINSTEWANTCLRYGIISGGNATPSLSVEPNEQIIAFVTRLYSTCLNRQPDQEGLDDWSRLLASMRQTGKNVAHDFFFSAEFLRKNISSEEYIRRLYLTFLDREPEQEGFNAWLSQLNSGVSREEVFRGIAESPEFRRICLQYGIIP